MILEHRQTRIPRTAVNKVLVAGSINMDVVASAPRHPRPGETIPGSSLALLPGGKGLNQAIASARAGATTALIGCLGNDAFGDTLAAFLAASGVEVHRVRRVRAPTGTALIVVSAAGENTIVVIPGANGLFSPADLTGVEAGPGDIFLSQFEIPLETVEAFFVLGRSIGARTILNAAPARSCSRALLALVDILVVNETELAFLLGIDVPLPEDAAGCAARLRSWPGQIVIVTLGGEGAVALVGVETLRVPGRRVPVVDTTGAGDCFVGALAGRLARGETLAAALGWANVAASLCVQRAGAASSLPTAEEVAAVLD